MTTSYRDVPNSDDKTDTITLVQLLRIRPITATNNNFFSRQVAIATKKERLKALSKQT